MPLFYHKQKREGELKTPDIPGETLLPQNNLPVSHQLTTQNKALRFEKQRQST